MKKITGLLAALILLTACDDGDMTFRSFNFTDDNPEQCSGDNNTLYFKRNGTEVLIFEIADINLPNVATGDEGPAIIDVSLLYRNYNGNVALTALCSEIPPLNPSVTEEWQGEGRLVITTSPVYDNDDEDGVDRVVQYNHQITLQSATFANNGEEVTISNVNLGTIEKPLGFNFDFLVEPTEQVLLEGCNPTGPFYRLSGSEALVLTLEAQYVNAGVGTVNVPMQPTTDGNNLLLRVFSGTIGESSICDITPPVSPFETQRWNAALGEVRIVTTQNNNTLTHTVYLENVIFDDESSTAVYQVLPATGFLIGSFNTLAP
jgi:hypothetical protein